MATVIEDGDHTAGVRAVCSEYAPGGTKEKPALIIVAPKRSHKDVGPTVLRHFIREVGKYVRDTMPDRDDSQAAVL